MVFALLKRFLEHEGLEVTLVENVTDVNDKIYDAAREAGVPSAELARRDDRALRGRHRPARARPPRPRAARRRDDRRDRRPDPGLVDSGHAYAAGGDVYFRVASFDDYGKLSNRPLDEMEQGEGDDAADLKESPQDFALWKAHKEGEDTRWPSPWGEGRPGWHIECSAMAEQLLGTDFEIHGGGSDLVFPHHENEIAQTEAARGQPLARIWMHNGMVQMGTEKMAKSVGNIRLLHEALEEFGRDALVMYFAGGHYRQPLAFSAEALEEAGRAVERLRELCRRLDPAAPRSRRARRARRAASSTRWPTTSTPRPRAQCCSSGSPRPTAGSTPVSDGPGAAWRDAPRARAGEPARGRGRGAADGEAERLLEEREAARAARDFERADAIRDELAALGWEVRDTPEGAAAGATPAVIVYGRNPVREALRGRRDVRRVWATEAAAGE